METAAAATPEPATKPRPAQDSRASTVHGLPAHGDEFSSKRDHTASIVERVPAAPAPRTRYQCVLLGVALAPQGACRYWLARHRGQLGAAVAVGVVGALDFISGRVPRAPLWMRRRGLEWHYQLSRAPWRSRHMLALPRVVLAVTADLRRVWMGSHLKVGGRRGRQ